jgi:hypothetical protein
VPDELYVRLQMNNPYVLLRIMVLLDVILIVVGVIIPDFKDDSLIDYILNIKDLEPKESILAVMWLVNMLALIVSWIGLVVCKSWGRILYVAFFPLVLALTFLRGNSGYGPGIFAVGIDLINFYYGFMVCMLFFGPVSVVFNRKAT